MSKAGIAVFHETEGMQNDFWLFWHVRPSKTQISLRSHAVSLVFIVCIYCW